MSVANGVVLLVRETYADGWELVERDVDGQGLVANLIDAAGRVMQALGSYGVTGTSLPGFESQPAHAQAEAELFGVSLATEIVVSAWLCIRSLILQSARWSH